MRRPGDSTATAARGAAAAGCVALPARSCSAAEIPRQPWLRLTQSPISGKNSRMKSNPFVQNGGELMSLSPGIQLSAARACPRRGLLPEFAALPLGLAVEMGMGTPQVAPSPEVTQDKQRWHGSPW